MSTIILNDDNGNPSAYIIPEGQLRVEMGDEDGNALWSPYPRDSERLVIDDLGAYTMLTSTFEAKDSNATAIHSAMELITGRLDQIRQETRRQRQHDAVVGVLNSAGVASYRKTPAELATMLINALEGMK